MFLIKLILLAAAIYGWYLGGKILKETRQGLRQDHSSEGIFDFFVGG